MDPDICAAAKSAFENRVAGLSTKLSTFSDLQGRIAIWQDYNFGPGPAWHKAMGVAEEIFELCDATLEFCDKLVKVDDSESIDDKDIVDACSDAAIYSMSFCTSVRSEYDVLFSSTSIPASRSPLLALHRSSSRRIQLATDLKEATLLVGRAAKPLQHSVLKNAQNIRGFDDVQKLVLWSTWSIGEVARASAALLRLLNKDLEQCVFDTAEKVLKRDWKNNPVNAAEIVANGR